MKPRNCLAIIFIMVIALLPQISSADLTLEDTHASLKRELYSFKSDTALSIDDVRRMPLSDFTAPLGRDFSDGYSRAHYWFRFTLDFEHSQIHDWFLEIPFSLLDTVILYQPTLNGDYEATKVGDRLVFSDRVIPVKNFLFPLDNQQRKQTYYMYVSTQDSVQVPIGVWPEQEYMPEYAQTIGLQMAFFGAMLVMMIYNIFIFISTRDKTYLFYIGFIGLMLLFQLGLQGFSHQWIWPNNPWWSNISIPLLGVLSLNCGLLFVRKLLQTRQTLPKFDVVLRCISYAMVITVPVIVFGDYDFAIDVSLVVTSIFFNLTLIAIILLVLKGDRTAKIVLVAWSVFLISGSLSMLGVQGWLPLEVAGTHVLQIGSMMEVVLLSLALADRIKILRKEKLDMEIMSSEILQISNDQLEKSNRMKDAFIATISHEIKTPMNAILGSSQLLREETLNDQQIEYVDTIDRSGDLLVSILDNVLEYSKLEAGKVVIKEREVDTEDMFEEILSLFDVQLRDKPIQLWLSFSDNVPAKIYIDDALFKHVIMNLLSNAIKFTAKGFVWLHVSAPINNKLKIEVSDTGIGMNSEQQARIFKAFTQADDSTSRSYGGTGLGLVISKNICTLMQGAIDVASESGVGTTFSATVSVRALSDAISFVPIDMELALGYERETQRVISRFGATNQNSRYRLTRLANHQLEVTNGISSFALRKVITARSLLAAIKSISDKQKNSYKPRGLAKKAGATLNVMAVDDDPTNRMIIEKILKHLKVDVRIADSGESAVSAFLVEKFDLILMDIEMPDMDGYQTTQAIRALEHEGNLDPTLIIALSAHVSPEFKTKALESGMDDFFNKPVQISKLKKCLDGLKASA